MTDKLATVAALFSGAAGFSLCANSAAMAHDKDFKTPAGVAGTCGYWLNNVFERLYPLDTADRCKQMVEINLPNVTGSSKMPVMEVLAFMARPENQDGAGCCGEDTGGSVCAQFVDQLTSSPCPAGEVMTNVGNTERKEEKCLPCYNNIVEQEYGNPECRSCWGADTGGCDMAECLSLEGVWDDGRCRMCSSADSSGCMEAASCEAAGGVWWSSGQGMDSGECRQCKPEDDNIWGCKEEQCQGGTLRWKWHDPAGGSGECQVCDPEKGRVYGCGKVECLALKTDYPMVNYMESHCGFCNPGDGDHYSCSQEYCVPSNEFPDMLWVAAWRWNDENQSMVEWGYCTRCFEEESDDRNDKSGCMTRQQCVSASPKFQWKKECPDAPMDTGGPTDCCQMCDHHDPTGCDHKEACEDFGGKWCQAEDRCLWSHESCNGDSPPPSGGGGGTCVQVAKRSLDMAYAKGYTPRYC